MDFLNFNQNEITELPEDPIQRAMTYLWQGNKPEASKLLASLLRANPADENGWMLLTYCVDTTERKIFCAQRALAINPDNRSAWAIIDFLQSKHLPSLEVFDTIPDQPTPDVVSSIDSQNPNMQSEIPGEGHAFLSQREQLPDKLPVYKEVIIRRENRLVAIPVTGMAPKDYQRLNRKTQPRRGRSQSVFYPFMMMLFAIIILGSIIAFVISIINQGG